MNGKIWTVAAALMALAGCGGSRSDSVGGQASSEPVAAPTTLSVSSDGAPPAFAVCRGCHSTQAGQNSVGPSLAGIVGSTAGAVPDYPFSAALKASGLVWTPQTLDIWLQGPMKMVPGTRMVQAVPDPAARKAIIAYLQTLK